MFSLAFVITTIVVDLKNFQYTALDANGHVLRVGLTSGGRKYCPDIKRGCKTPSGIFKVISKRGKHYRSPLYPVACGYLPGLKRCAPMPWYTKFNHQGPGFHGSNDNWEKPKHISHGCLHVKTEDGKWIHDNSEIGYTTVVVLPY